ncbi:von Willebrand factor type A domain-containing protein [Paraoerskovia marina]|uniref:von Willebrand factor type A domain-containing protein n=1 Tax=Paraoerskovia marina TaxID=545619 RepID=A0A1H1NVN4_9CELL|nr:VWA domain-containing protein [Paraoerskovia marina]SDS03036.1 von Willebrand factor type A domain-containing protein [Paraoerskovia marina]
MVARTRRIVAAALGLVIGTTASLVTVVPAVAAGGDLSDAGADGFADVSSCVASADTLLASIVVDESGSLQETDPGAARVGAVETAVDSLSGLQGDAGDGLTVETSLAVFGSTYEELVGWGSVDGAHGELLVTAAQNQLPERDTANLTDYRAALTGAQQSLDARAEDLDGTTCKTVLWFTDGRLDVDGTGEGAATESAREDLCTANGVVDGVRGDDVSIIALALFIEGDSSTVTEADREFLRAIAEGTGGGGVECGHVPIAAEDSAGAYLRADQPDGLRRLFAGAGALIDGATPGQSALCPEEACTDGTLDFAVDEGIGGFRAVVQLDEGTDAPTLISPDGDTVTLNGETVKVDDATVVTTSRDGLVTADVTFSGGGSPGGTWRLVADPAGQSAIDLYYFWRATLGVDAADGIVLGEPSQIEVSTSHADGSSIDPETLGSYDVTLTMDGEPVDLSSNDDGTFTAEVTVPASSGVTEVDLTATATALSAPSGIALGPVVSSTSVPAALPPSYATMETRRLDLPDVVGDEPSTGTVTFTGSEDGDTEACFGTADVSGPESAGAVTLTSADGCVEIPAGETVTSDVEVSTRLPADGRITGTIPVTLTGVGADEDLTVDLPVNATMTRPVDEVERWGLVLGLMLLALLIAWVVSWLTRMLVERYALGDTMNVAAVPVVLTPGGLRRTEPRDEAGEPSLLSDLDFGPVAERRNQGSFDTRGLTFGRQGLWNPFAEVQGVVRSDDGAIVVTNDTAGLRVMDDKGRSAPVDIPGTRQFFLVVSPADAAEDEIAARLVVLADGKNGLTTPASRWSDDLAAYEGWDSVVDTVRAAAVARQAAERPPKEPKERRDRGAATSAGADTAPSRSADDLFGTGSAGSTGSTPTAGRSPFDPASPDSSPFDGGPPSSDPFGPSSDDDLFGDGR